MATILFFEKPGCINNTKQKTILAANGHTVIALSLLEHRFRPEELRAYFGDLPIPQWFNPTAPRIKNGEIDPTTMDEGHAIAAMLADRLLIRRPLMDVEGWKTVGFVPEVLAPHLGDVPAALEACPKSHQDTPCP